MPSGSGALADYHERTKHSPARLRQTPHVLDWDVMPIPFKVYPDLEPIPLPRHFTTSTRPVLATLLDPTPPAPAATAFDLQAIARLLMLTAGVLRTKAVPGGERHYRAAACTGALYHVDLWLVCAELPALPAGVYHFGPHDVALRRLRAGDHRGAVVAATAGAAAAAAAPVLLVYTSTFWRNAWKYRARAYRHCFWDAGTMLANLLALAAASGMPATIVQGFVDDALDALLDVDGAREVVLGVVALGAGAAPPPPPPASAPLALATLPLSSREVTYPEMRAAHDASRLANAAAVAAWRDTRVPPCGGHAPGARIPLEPLPPSAAPRTVEDTILRRGSTRRFAREPIDFAQLSTVLLASSTPVSTDLPLALDRYVIANAVDGLPAGTYAVDESGRALEPLGHGDARLHAGHLALGQALAADAAVNVYWMVDLGPVLAALGGRGYRVAQLLGGIGGGRTYLAAYALGLGATGLTFFDDEVTRFFSPHADGKSVLFLMAVGHRLRAR